MWTATRANEQSPMESKMAVEILAICDHFYKESKITEFRLSFVNELYADNMEQ